MATDMDLAIEERLTQLLQHLGLSQAHFSAHTVSDW